MYSKEVWLRSGPGVVDEEVEAAEAVPDGIRNAVDHLLIGDVQHEGIAVDLFGEGLKLLNRPEAGVIGIYKGLCRHP